MPRHVQKRNGNTVSFNEENIKKAVTKAAFSVSKELLPDQINAITAYVVSKTEPGTVIPIVRIQDLVEEGLMNIGEYQIAKSYILYRNEKDSKRDVLVTKSENIKNKLEKDHKVFENDKLREFVYLRTYSRWIEEEGRRETWVETVRRYMEFLTVKIGDKLTEEEYTTLENAIVNMDILPSMRLLWSAGKGAGNNNIAAYNCSYMGITGPEDLADLIFLLMSGTGVGVSVEKQFIDQFPGIQQLSAYQPTELFRIQDSKEGWAAAQEKNVKQALRGVKQQWDFSEIRPAGARLRTGGGRSSGPAPLKDLLTFTYNKIHSRRDEGTLRSIDIYDIVCKTAEIVLCGGTRRSAIITIFDKDDHEMMNAKQGQFWQHHPHRSLSNNSIVFNTNPDNMELLSFWKTLMDNGTGEPGFINRSGMVSRMPDRRKAILTEKDKKEVGTNPCLHGDTLVYVADGRGTVPIRQLAEEEKDVDVFCTDKKGKVVVRRMRNPRVTGYNQPIYKVTLDDGSVIRTTGNHKLLKKSGNYVEVQNLKQGDSLEILTRFEGSWKDIFKEANSFSQDYYWVNYNRKQPYTEHGVIAEHKYDTPVRDGLVCHHLDGNGKNNSPDNIVVMPKKEHDALHGKEMIGDLNPMRRAVTEWSEEKWEEYRRKQSVKNTGEGNGRYSGFTEEDLRFHAVSLTKLLNKRFTVNDWQSYAKPLGLPLKFSKWRVNKLGDILDLSKWAANSLGIAWPNLDPRIVETFNKYTKMGYVCCIENNEVFLEKTCEICSCKFTTPYVRREVSVCSSACRGKKMEKVLGDEYVKRKMMEGMRKSHAEKKEILRKKQIEVFLDFKFNSKREPSKQEWADACKQKEVSFEISRKSSPFRYYDSLKEQAGMYNHKVVSVELDGMADVYNGTVDEFHNFFIGGFEGKTANGKRKLLFLNNLQCGEIVMGSSQNFCNLTTVVVRPTDSHEDLLRKVNLAAILGTYQSTLTDFTFIQEEWKQNCEKERLLGVSLTGIYDHFFLSDPTLAVSTLHSDLLNKLKKEVVDTNIIYSSKFGVTASTACTCIKPEGTTSQLANCSSGISPRYSPYYIRRIRITANDPLLLMLKDQGVPCFPEVGQRESEATTFVLEFPVKAPEGTKHFVSDTSTDDQLNLIHKFKKHYTEHSVSATVHIGANEWIKTLAWVEKNWDDIGGLAFLPKDNNVYQLAPYEEITKEEYEKRAEILKNIDFSKLVYYEHEDSTTGAKTYACQGGHCEL